MRHQVFFVCAWQQLNATIRITDTRHALHFRKPCLGVRRYGVDRMCHVVFTSSAVGLTCIATDGIVFDVCHVLFLCTIGVTR